MYPRNSICLLFTNRIVLNRRNCEKVKGFLLNTILGKRYVFSFMVVPPDKYIFTDCVKFEKLKDYWCMGTTITTRKTGRDQKRQPLSNLWSFAFQTLRHEGVFANVGTHWFVLFFVTLLRKRYFFGFLIARSMNCSDELEQSIAIISSLFFYP